MLLTEEEMITIPQRISEDKLDAAFVRGPILIPEGLASLTLINDSFCITLPVSDPLAQDKEPVEPSELMGKILILPEQSSGMLEVARRGAFSVDESVKSGSLIDVLARVSFGEGLAIVPDILQYSTTQPQIVFREMSGPPVLSEINIIFRKWDKSPLVKVILKHPGVQPHFFNGGLPLFRWVNEQITVPDTIRVVPNNLNEFISSPSTKQPVITANAGVNSDHGITILT